MLWIVSRMQGRIFFRGQSNNFLPTFRALLTQLFFQFQRRRLQCIFSHPRDLIVKPLVKITDKGNAFRRLDLVIVDLRVAGLPLNVVYLKILLTGWTNKVPHFKLRKKVCAARRARDVCHFCCPEVMFPPDIVYSVCRPDKLTIPDSWVKIDAPSAESRLDFLRATPPNACARFDLPPCTLSHK